MDTYPNTGAFRSVLHYSAFAPCVSGLPSCDPTSPSCTTPFQTAPFSETCSLIIPGGNPVGHSFYGRSLLGQWTLVIPSTQLAGLGTIEAFEVTFLARGSLK